MSKKGLVNEIHRQARKNFQRRRVIFKGIDDLWQADLVEMGLYAAENKGFRYLLTVIDCFSKYAWTVAVKSKTSKDVCNAMQSILIQTRRPKYLQTDHGKEFYNKIFGGLMEKYSISHYSTYSPLKASIVERFNRTLKSMMWKEFSFQGTYKWIDKYQELVKKYNNTYHRTIKMPPIKVNSTNEKQILNSCYNHIKVLKKPKFKIGDMVRISKYKHEFEKGYTPNWTTEVFKIHRIQITNPVTYILKDYQNKPIKGGFYEKELQKTNFPTTFLVEKILKRKGDRVYVKWLGFDKEHNSWINKNDLI